MVTILRIASSSRKRLRHLSAEVSLGISWLDQMPLLPNLSGVVMTKLRHHRTHLRSKRSEQSSEVLATSETQTEQGRFMHGRPDLRMGKVKFST